MRPDHAIVTKAGPGLSRADRLRLTVVLVVVMCGLGPSAGTGLATFGASVSSQPSTLATATCFPGDVTPPTVDGTVISKSGQFLSGAIRPGRPYEVYASVSDAGCGVATVRADVSQLTTGETDLDLAAGSFAVGGTTFGHRSATLSAGGGLADGPYPYAITVTDVLGNGQTVAGFTVVVDGTRPSGADVQTGNGGATVGRAEAGDTITFRYSEVVDPDSIVAGWTGAATPVVVRITNNGNNDRLVVRDASNSAALPLGTTRLGGNYVAAARDFGASGTPSTMTWAGDTVTVTLGTPSGATLTVVAPATMAWPPSSTATDAAGNASRTTSTAETGAADVEF